SEELRKLTAAARTRQRIRYGANYTNAIVPIKLFEEKTHFSSAQLARIETVSFQEKLSSRSTMKILRLARTISDVAGDDQVTDIAVDEALEWKISASRTHSSLMR
ncbi:Mg chelatase subunit ChlI, partial [Planococcus antarcticus DSM 14505]